MTHLTFDAVSTRGAWPWPGRGKRLKESAARSRPIPARADDNGVTAQAGLEMGITKKG